MNRSNPVWYDSHMHTPLCKHAEGHPREYVRFGHARGLKGVTFTCHSPMPDGWSAWARMDPSEFDRYVQLIDEARSSAPEGFEVRLGLESDFFPGMEPWLEKLHQQAEFHYVMGSVHWHLVEYRDAFWRGDIRAFQKQFFEHLAESAETGLFDALAHPDLVKNASPETWDLRGQLEEYVLAALDRIARTGVALELNTSGLSKIYAEMNPGPVILKWMREREIPVVVGSDAHRPYRVGDGFPKALDLLEQAGYEEVSFFQKRRRLSISIAQVRGSLKEPDSSLLVAECA